MIFNWNRWKRVCKINITFNRIHKNSIYSLEAGFFLNNLDNDFVLLCSRCTWLVHTPRSSSFELRFNCYNHKILLRGDNVSVNIQVNLITCELVTNLNKSNLTLSQWDFKYLWRTTEIWYHQESFMSEMEWVSFKCLFWRANDSIPKLKVSIKAVFLCDTGLVIKIR